MNLSDASIQQLNDEIEKRKRTLPTKVDNINFDRLVELAEKHLHKIASHMYDGESDDTIIFEAVFEVIYGEDIWDWYNANTD